MPYPNEHSARVKDPGGFDPTSFRSKDLKGGIRIIIGKLKGEDSMVTQAYRFPVDQFTVEEAKKWLKDHNISYLKFEPAQNESDEKIVHTGVMGMRWGKRQARSVSSDHKTYSNIRKKKIKDMTDDDLRKVAKRIQLTKEYKASKLRKSGKKISELTNEEIQTEINRSKLKGETLKGALFVSRRKMKDIDRMSSETVKKALDRKILEKNYKDLVTADIGNVIAVGKFVREVFIDIKSKD